ncbi:type II secretion system F family protein [Butyrivibrio sp. MC2013]|uniref:type II secretion system F family protein n=1 Tax=Butyrivibrio sp. MC2013 TaxID=1280686 RepID=UPI000417BE70|nr:type II secretion system F family protein [Butyrivibrio sp. MC2013]
MDAKVKSRKKRELSDSELAAFCGQFAMLLEGGIAPTEATDILLSDTSDTRSKELLTDLLSMLRQGERFHIALGMCQVFPPYVISMIRIGEETGNLDTVLASLSAFYQREDELKEATRSAITYPSIITLMIFVIVMILLTKVMPIFAQVFAQLGTGMSGFSQILLNIGNSMSKWSMVIISLVATFSILLFLSTQTRRGRRIAERAGMHFGPFHDLICDMAISRFAGGMSMAIRSGMDTYTSLQLIKRIVENKEIADKVDVCIDEITKEASFPEAIKKTGMFNAVYTRMLLVGFRSGSMDKVLSQIADKYDKDAMRKISILLSIIEPALVIILSFIVGMVLLSVILPLMGIMSQIG